MLENNIKFVGLLLILLTGCSQSEGLRKVQQKWTNGEEIVALPNHDYEFLVRMKDGSVYLTESDGFDDAKLQKSVMLFPPNK